MNNSDHEILSKGSVTVVIAGQDNENYKQEKLKVYLESLERVIKQQYIEKNKIIILDIEKKEQTGTNGGIETKKCVTFAKGIKDVVENLSTDYLVIIDSREAPVFLKYSAVYSFIMALKRFEKVGMVYSDYDTKVEGKIKECHLLEYHNGRVRDNFDMGKVFAFSKKAIQSIELDDKLEYGVLYDIRLKISELYTINHISNRFNGSLYTVEQTLKSHNVFDYLQSEKKVQLEMEKILTDHLKRIKAYLAPGENQGKRPETKKTDVAISIIIPVNNRPGFIATAIESALVQTIKDKIEVIVVVNGGYDDPTIEIVEKYLKGGEFYNPELPCVYLMVSDINNIGLCLNMGLEKAKGQYYLQLDSDDRLKPRAAEIVLKSFQDNPYAGMVIGSYEVWEKKEDNSIVRQKNMPVVKHEEWTKDNGHNNLLRINGAGAPRAYDINIVKEVGWFGINDEPFVRNYGEDYEMVLKISEKYQIERIWEPVYDVVRHSGGTDHSIDQHTIDRNDNAKDLMRLKAIQRRQGSVALLIQ